MTENKSVVRPAIVGFLILALITGVIYTFVCTGIGQLLFNHKANGSIITGTSNGQEVQYGSEFLAQPFTDPKYLIGRPWNDGVPTNLNPVGNEQAALVQERIDWWHELDPENTADIPMELVTVGGSGYDPEITPAGAEYQVARIARERGIGEEEVREIITANTEDRAFGVLGEPTVNVLKVNLALDGIETE